MTTIKEYKAMMEYNKKHKLVIPDLEIEEKRFKEISILLFSLTPELIRVIELAEEALYGAEHILGGRITTIQKTNAYTKIREALSEIRKLKGE